ncbi:MAG: N-acetylmuramoyl-L-alanine amidase [Opitutales bacterium]|jgi:N-acetylmuramoyl-L-alanine amidase
MKTTRWNILFLLMCMTLGLYPLDVKAAPTAGGQQQEQYLSVVKQAEKLGLQVKKSLAGDKLQYRLESKWSTVVLRESTRSCELNGITIHLSRAVIKRHGTLYISLNDYQKTIEPLLLPQNQRPPPGAKRVVIDPGHGGKDNGAENKSLKIKEKNLTLSLALTLKKTLESRGYTVFVTRGNDEFIPLDERPKKAADLKADIFISLHFNATSTSSVTGAETYILPPSGQPSTSGSSFNGNATLPGNSFDPWNMLLGYYVQRELVNSLGTGDRGVKRARFAVLRTLNCPGILVEGGFVSNNKECASIAGAAYRQKMATSIADAVDAYARTVRRVAAGK